MTETYFQIPSKYDLIKNYWFISPGILSITMHKKSLIEISTTSFTIEELEFIFFVTVSSLIKYLELFSFDFTPIMIHIIKQQLSFFKTMCLKQKHSTFFVSQTYIDQLSKVFQSLIDLKRWRFVEQQICVDEIERICNFFKWKLKLWFQSSQLKAYLWRWGFKEEVTAIVYYSFLVPKIQKLIDVMLKNGSQYLEKMESCCKCSILMNFNLGLHIYEYDYFVMEVVFDIYRGKPLGFLDMLRYLMKTIDLTKYFLKNLRTVIIKNSQKFLFVSNTPLRTLRLLGRTVECGESIEPFFTKIDCTKSIFSRHVLFRSQSADSSLEKHKNSYLKNNNINWTTEMGILDFWKDRIKDLTVKEYKYEVSKINESFQYWEEIYQQLISTNDKNKYNVNSTPMFAEFNDFVAKCQQQITDEHMFMKNDINIKMKKEVIKHKFLPNINVGKDGDNVDVLYEQLFRQNLKPDTFLPSVTNMRYLMRKQTGIREKHEKLTYKRSSLHSSRSNLLTNQAIFHLRRSSKVSEIKFTKHASRVSGSKEFVITNELNNRKMILDPKEDSNDSSEDALSKFPSGLRTKLREKIIEGDEKWKKILNFDYDWKNLKSDLKIDNDNTYKWCPLEYYHDFKRENPIPSQLKDTPLISIFLTLQMLTDKTIVYSTHFRELNEGKSIDIPIILDVNKTILKPTFFGYLNGKGVTFVMSKFQILICQLAFDSFLITLQRHVFFNAIFLSHAAQFKDVINSQTVTIIPKITEALNLQQSLSQIEHLLRLPGKKMTFNNEMLTELSNEMLFLHEFLFQRKCCSWMEHKYYGIRVIYHSLFLDGNTKCIEPFLRLPGDRRIKKIEIRCNCIIALRETLHSVMNSKRYLIEIFYDFFSGNHFSCVELISSMVTDNYGKGAIIKAHRTLICYPSGELWVFPDIEWLKCIGNYA